MKFYVGIFVGVCNFKLIHSSYNSVCYEMSLTAGTELILYDDSIEFYLNELHPMTSGFSQNCR